MSPRSYAKDRAWLLQNIQAFLKNVLYLWIIVVFDAWSPMNDENCVASKYFLFIFFILKYINFFHQQLANNNKENKTRTSHIICRDYVLWI